MQVIAIQALKLLGNILGGWLIQFILSPDNMKWAMMWCARRIVNNTKTTADDEWLAQLEKSIAAGAAKEQPASGSQNESSGKEK